MKWTDNWEKTSKSSNSGGQGEVYQVCKINNISELGALKLMHESQAKSTTRRGRFYQEITALSKLDNKGVPRIIEFSSLDDETPYFISEWIDGEDLSSYISKKSLPVNEALELTRELALIVDSCHQSDVIHRDIKPQNILIREDKPILVDFGICWLNDENESSLEKTALGEELGNRFLRLPELTAGSLVKHEKICDVTFIVGILFYLITKKHPRQLKDSENKMPHERFNENETKQLIGNSSWNKVKRIFNVGFQQSSSLRFKSCIELINAIDKALSPPYINNKQEELDEHKKILFELINTDELIQRRESVEKFVRLNESLYRQILEELSSGGIIVGYNQSITNIDNTINIHISNNMFPDSKTILIHKIGIIGSNTICSYEIQGVYYEKDRVKIYYEGYITDIDSLEESINQNKPIFLAEAITHFTNQIRNTA